MSNKTKNIMRHLQKKNPVFDEETLSLIYQYHNARTSEEFRKICNLTPTTSSKSNTGLTKPSEAAATQAAAAAIVACNAATDAKEI